MMNIFFKKVLVLFMVLSFVVSCSNNNNNSVAHSTNISSKVVLLFPAKNMTNVSPNITFKWASFYTGNGSVTYSLYLGKSANTLVKIADNLTDTEYSYNGVTLSTIFFWKVVMISGNKVIGESDIWSFTTTSPPGKFSLISPADNSVLAKSMVTLEWSSSKGAVNYEVYIGTDKDNIKKIGETSELHFNVPLSQYGETYFWKIVAVDSTGGRIESNTRSFILNRAPGKPILISPYYYEQGTSISSILQWENVIDPDGDPVSYNVYFGTTTSPEEVAKGITTTEFFPGELSPSTTYYWKVEAVDSYGNKSMSELWVFVTNYPPSKPLLIQPTNNASTVYISPILQWERSIDPDGDTVTYNLYFGTTTSPAEVASGITENIFPVGYLKIHKKYYWRVEAVDSNGLISKSDLWSFTTDAPPNPPLLDTPSDTSTLVVLNPTRFQWYASTSTESSSVTYTIYLKKAGESFSEKVTSITGTSYDLYNLSPGTTYYWKVAAVNQSGMMAESTVWKFSTDKAPGKPTLASPSNLSTHIGLKPTELKWYASNSTESTPVSYTIYLKKEGGKFFEEVTGITGTSYDLMDLSPGTIYYWKIAAINQSGMMAESTVWEFKTDYAPEKPRLFSPVNNTNGFPTDGIVKWHSVGDVEGDPVSYKVCYSRNVNGSFTTTCTPYVTDTQYDFSGKPLLTYTNYHWYVVAEDSLGAEAKSDVWSFTTDRENKNINYIDAAKYDTYYIDSEGNLWAFGKNGEGELADGTTIGRNKPELIRNPRSQKWVKVGAGSLHVCAVDESGYLYCWGWDYYGQLGIGYETPAAQTSLHNVSNPDGNNWVDVDGGDGHTCAVDSKGLLYCWGENNYKQAGQENTNDITSPKIVANSSGNFWTDVDVGYLFSCARDSQNRLWCWGDNSHGQVASTSPSAYPIEITNNDGSGWSSSFSAGYDHACAIDLNGSLWCWGSNSDGQIGNGNIGVNVDAFSPEKITNPENSSLTWKSVKTNGYNTCAIDENNVLWCWGRGYDGEIGNGTFNGSDVPVKVEDGNNIAWNVVGIGLEHVCAAENNTLWCWGTNSYGQLGLGLTHNNFYTTPELITNRTNSMWKSINASYNSSYGISVNNKLYAWGNNNKGQLANYKRLIYNDYDFPIEVSSDTDFVFVSGGYDDACAIDANKHLWCVGGNSYGQLGDGTNNDSNYPVMITNSLDSNWSMVRLGYLYSCGIDVNNNLWCWGHNNDGQLGTGDNTDSNYPVLISNSSGTKWAYISLGYSHTCGIDIVGNLWCWGDNTYGKLGTGNDTSYSYPVLVTNSHGTQWSSVSLGPKQTCGIDVDNNLWCWGDNSLGQLGTGDNTDSNYPVLISNSSGTKWSSVSLGQYSTCGIDAKKTLWCWGSNNYGQLGNSNATGSNAPIVVRNPAGSLWSEVSLGSAHVCSIDVNDDLWCWGEDSNYQVGIGEALRIFPAKVYGY